MKNVTRILALTLMMMPLVAVAQLQQGQKLVSDVPFEFVVGNKIVPAGNWVIQKMYSGSNFFYLNDQAGKVGLISNASVDETKTPATNCALVFHVYKGRHFLAGMKLEGSKITYRVPVSKAEAELRAQNAVAQDEVLLAQLR